MWSLVPALWLALSVAGANAPSTQPVTVLGGRTIRPSPSDIEPEHPVAVLKAKPGQSYWQMIREYQRTEAVRASRERTESPNPRRDFVIRMERTSCEGSCPAYTVTVLGDRSVTYVGQIAGKGRLSTKDYDALVGLIERMDFFGLKEEYSGTVTDMPGVMITVVAPYGVHGVWHYAMPCETDFRALPATSFFRPTDAPVTPPPDDLCKLESMIDHVTKLNRMPRNRTAPPGDPPDAI